MVRVAMEQESPWKSLIQQAITTETSTISVCHFSRNLWFKHILNQSHTFWETPKSWVNKSYATLGSPLTTIPAQGNCSRNMCMNSTHSSTSIMYRCFLTTRSVHREAHAFFCNQAREIWKQFLLKHIHSISISTMGWRTFHLLETVPSHIAWHTYNLVWSTIHASKSNVIYTYSICHPRYAQSLHLTKEGLISSHPSWLHTWNLKTTPPQAHIQYVHFNHGVEDFPFVGDSSIS